MTTPTTQPPALPHAAAATPASPPTLRPAAVGTFASHADATAAVRALARAGFDLQQLSLIGNDYHTVERPAGFYNVGDRMKLWGARGAFWGGLLGLALSPALMLLPVIGHVVVLGPLASALAGTLEGAALGGGASLLGAALAGIGVPRDAIVRYEAEVKADKFLLVVHDAPDVTDREDLALLRDRAEAILRESGAESVDRY